MEVDEDDEAGFATGPAAPEDVVLLAPSPLPVEDAAAAVARTAAELRACLERLGSPCTAQQRMQAFEPRAEIKVPGFRVLFDDDDDDFCAAAASASASATAAVAPSPSASSHAKIDCCSDGRRHGDCMEEEEEEKDCADGYDEEEEANKGAAWSAEEETLFSELFAIFGRSWGRISQLMCFHKSPAQLFLRWRGGDHGLVGGTCDLCFEDESFAGPVLVCAQCRRCVHPACCKESTPRWRDPETWYCSQECECMATGKPLPVAPSPFSANPPFGPSPSPLSLQQPKPTIASPAAAAAAAAVSSPAAVGTPSSDMGTETPAAFDFLAISPSGYFLLCAFPNCRTFPKASRFCFVDETTDPASGSARSYYGVPTTMSGNIVRHAAKTHKYSRGSQKQALQELVEKGLVVRVHQSKIIRCCPRRSDSASSQSQSQQPSPLQQSQPLFPLSLVASHSLPSDTSMAPGIDGGDGDRDDMMEDETHSECGFDAELLDIFGTNSLPPDSSHLSAALHSSSGFRFPTAPTVPAGIFAPVPEPAMPRPSEEAFALQPSSTATVCALLRRFRWGLRCSSCMECDTAFFSGPPPHSPSQSYARVLQPNLHIPDEASDSGALLNAAVSTVRSVISDVEMLVSGMLSPFVAGGGLVPSGLADRSTWVLAVRADMVDVCGTFMLGNEFTWEWNMNYGQVRAGDKVYFWAQVPEAHESSDTVAAQSRFVGTGKVLVGPRIVPERGIVGTPGLGFPTKDPVARVRVVVLDLFIEPITQAALRSDSTFSRKRFMQSNSDRIETAPMTNNQVERLKFIASHAESTRNLPVENFLAALQLATLLDEMPGRVLPSAAHGMDDARFRTAVEWLAVTNHIELASSTGAEQYQLCRSLPTMHHLRIQLAHESRVLFRKPLLPGHCHWCGEGPRLGTELVQCSEGCGVMCHRECCFLKDTTATTTAAAAAAASSLSPPLSLASPGQWTCEDCVCRSTDASGCLVCGSDASEDGAITCSACDGWFHIKCLQRIQKKAEPNGEFWLCPSCLLSEYQATRCLLYVACSEVTVHCTDMLRGVAEKLCLQHRLRAKGCNPSDTNERLGALAGAIGKMRQMVTAVMAQHTSRWSHSVIFRTEEDRKKRLATEDSTPPNVVQYRRKKTSQQQQQQQPLVRSQSLGGIPAPPRLVALPPTPLRSGKRRKSAPSASEEEEEQQ